MKTKSMLALFAIPVAAASYVLFHPGIAYAETPMAKLAPSSMKQADGFTVDPMHTFIGFDIGHLGLSRVQGRFSKISGSIQEDPANMTNSSVDVTAQIDSVDTAVPPRDADLRSPNFFDAAKFPTLTFQSTKIRKHGTAYIADGNLTIKGVTKAVSIPFKQFGPIKDPWGGNRIGVVATPLVIHRSDFGMTYDADSISDDVTVRISLEATLNK